jgi:hypothetical protein
VLLAVLVLMNVQLEQSLPETSTKLMQVRAPTAVLAQTFARLKQSFLHKVQQKNKKARQLAGFFVFNTYDISV